MVIAEPLPPYSIVRHMRSGNYYVVYFMSKRWVQIARLGASEEEKFWLSFNEFSEHYYFWVA